MGGGGGSFVLPPAAPDLGTVFTLSAASDGVWNWIADPRAVTYNGYTYVGYVDSSGNVCVRVRNHATGTTGSEIVLHAALDADDHVNPSLWVRASDHKLLAWYARHEPLSTTMHQRISTASLDTDPTLGDGFGTEVDTDAQHQGRSYDYPQPIQLSTEADDVIWLFWRNIPVSPDRYNLVYSKSTDGGETWNALTTLYSNSTHSGRAYWKIASDGVDKIHVAMTDGSPNTDSPTLLRHFYYDAGTWRGSDGTDLGSPPFDFSDLTPVESSRSCLPYDIAISSSGKPVIVYAVYPTEFSDHRYRYARWTGTEWYTNEICQAGNGIGGNENAYSGGVTLDPDNPQIVYACREDGSAYNLFRYITADGGATFSEEQITGDSTGKNIRPFVPRGHVAGLHVVWPYGAYSGYESFNTGLRGYG